MANADEEKEPAVVDIASLDTYALIAMFIGILAEQAWRHMGLRMDPKTQEAKRDFERASVAIDCVEYMTGKLKGAVPEDEAKKLKALVADLQINFARERPT
jgi:hypothetical protein